MIKTVKIKANAKINIGLNILGTDDGYHMLDTVVSAINLFDTVTLKTRRDDLINLTVQGVETDKISVADNNVYKTAKAFMEKYGTNGADIVLKKNIPVGSGLGGSATDVVATVKAMAKAYEIEDDFIPFINSLCSDGEFLMQTGFARLQQRGNVVERFVRKEPFYLLICIPECESVTKSIFEEYDKGCYPSKNADIDGIISAIKGEESFPEREIFNALAEPAFHLNEEIKRAYDFIKSLSPLAVGMSGSGSAVYGIFESVDMCLWARDKADGKFKYVFAKETI